VLPTAAHRRSVLGCTSLRATGEDARCQGLGHPLVGVAVEMHPAREVIPVLVEDRA